MIEKPKLNDLKSRIKILQSQIEEKNSLLNSVKSSQVPIQQKIKTLNSIAESRIKTLNYNLHTLQKENEIYKKSPDKSLIESKTQEAEVKNQLPVIKKKPTNHLRQPSDDAGMSYHDLVSKINSPLVKANCHVIPDDYELSSIIRQLNGLKTENQLLKKKLKDATVKYNKEIEIRSREIEEMGSIRKDYAQLSDKFEELKKLSKLKSESNPEQLPENEESLMEQIKDLEKRYSSGILDGERLKQSLKTIKLKVKYMLLEKKRYLEGNVGRLEDNSSQYSEQDIQRSCEQEPEERKEIEGKPREEAEETRKMRDELNDERNCTVNHEESDKNITDPGNFDRRIDEIEREVEQTLEEGLVMKQEDRKQEEKAHKETETLLSTEIPQKNQAEKSVKVSKNCPNNVRKTMQNCYETPKKVVEKKRKTVEDVASAKSEKTPVKFAEKSAKKEDCPHPISEEVSSKPEKQEDQRKLSNHGVNDVRSCELSRNLEGADQKKCSHSSDFQKNIVNVTANYIGDARYQPFSKQKKSLKNPPTETLEQRVAEVKRNSKKNKEISRVLEEELKEEAAEGSKSLGKEGGDLERNPKAENLETSKDLDRYNNEKERENMENPGNKEENYESNKEKGIEELRQENLENRHENNEEVGNYENLAGYNEEKEGEKIEYTENKDEKYENNEETRQESLEAREANEELGNYDKNPENKEGENMDNPQNKEDKYEYNEEKTEGIREGNLKALHENNEEENHDNNVEKYEYNEEKTEDIRQENLEVLHENNEEFRNYDDKNKEELEEALHENNGESHNEKLANSIDNEFVEELKAEESVEKRPEESSKNPINQGKAKVFSDKPKNNRYYRHSVDDPQMKARNFKKFEVPEKKAKDDSSLSKNQQKLPFFAEKINRPQGQQGLPDIGEENESLPSKIEEKTQENTHENDSKFEELISEKNYEKVSIFAKTYLKTLDFKAENSRAGHLSTNQDVKPSSSLTSLNRYCINVNSTKPLIIFVLGGPGSGKGTQCARIKERFHFEHLSTGDLLREELSSGSEMASTIGQIMKEGRLVSSELLLQIVRARIQNVSYIHRKILLDGFPRNLENLTKWDEIIGDLFEVAFLLFFDCRAEILEQRILDRAKTSGRSDDNLESFKKRIKTFEEETKPVLQVFGERGQIIRVDSERSVEEVYAEVEGTFKEFGF